MNTHSAPATCVLSLDPASGIYRLEVADESFARLLAVPFSGPFMQDWHNAGLPLLCTERLRDAIENQSQLAWQIELGEAATARQGYLLSVSPVATQEAPAATATRASVLRSVVTFASAPVRWPALAAQGPGNQDNLHVEFALDAELQWTQLGHAWQQLTGYTPQESLGTPVAHMVHPNGLQTWQTLKESTQLGKGTAGRTRLPLVRRDGGICWVELGLVKARSDSPTRSQEPLWKGDLVDVSEYVRGWQLHRVRELAFDQASNGVVITDHTLPGEPIVYVNQSFCRITGYSPEEVMGLSCSFLQGSEKDQPEARLLGEALREGRSINVLLKNFHKNGSTFWNQLNISPMRDPQTGLITHYVGRQTDATELRQQLLMLRAQSEMLQALHHDNPNGMLAFDEGGQVSLSNLAFRQLTGLTTNGMHRTQLYQALQTLLAPGHGEIAQLLSEQQTTHLHLVKPQERVIEVRSGEKHKDGGPGLLVFRDVTAEVQLYKMQSHFLATAAHEMRAPMGSIRGFSELMLTRDYPEPVRRDLVDRIHRQAKRLSDLLNDLLDLSRIEAQGTGGLQLTPVSLHSALEDAIRSFDTSGRADQIRLDSHLQTLQINVHASKFEQVLINLLSNALKYSSPDSGPVTVKADLSQDGQEALITVRDQGIGMSPTTLKRLFTKFFRVDPDGDIEGTGLGLCIAKELTERMGGQITVESQLGQGSSFTLHFPLGTSLLYGEGNQPAMQLNGAG